ncbi:MAG: secondary thiamine-phosphate synthase enzyme YjbQ [Spirochaetes bacterium]|nr:secondary thiamine-phosphate synthase enzyme YjbQ [Spirochaetota bacterium]MBU0956878.1 secondary thiamine-phosphate synthase enzyme YjbQ [Spirochaetota bacterium]
MRIFQKLLVLPAFPRGCHLISDCLEEALPELADIKTGLVQLFLQHTSASLSINENADPTVRTDLESILRALVPDDSGEYRHDYEGSDDMSAHAKSSLLGCSLLLPLSSGRFNLGTWQGIYLCEHRNHGGQRRILATILAN